MWKVIPGYENYEVSDKGIVRRSIAGAGAVVGKIRAPYLQDGYLMITFGAKHERVHRLVALAFLGNPPIGKNEIRHLDGVKTNNKISNLCWGNRSENVQDAISHGATKKQGLLIRGENNGKSKLRNEDVETIKRMSNEGISYSKIAAHFSVSKNAIYKIMSGKSWIDQ
jgi:hypothetical protein